MKHLVPLARGNADACRQLLLAIDGEHLSERQLGKLYNAPLDVHLGPEDVYQPDIIFVSAANAAILQDWIRGAPDLVVEILSPGTAQRDLGPKKKKAKLR